MDIIKFREIIKNISALDPNASSEIEQCWKAEVAILAEDIPGTINFLKNECTEDEYAWISEIIDDLILATKSRDLLDCYRQLMEKFPLTTETYNIAFCVECAQQSLDNLD